MQGKHPISKKTRTILFDHDGTLIDSEQAHFAIWQDLLASYGVTLTDDFYTQVMAGIPVAQNAVDAVKAFSMTVTPAVLAEQKHEKTRQYLYKQAFPLMPYALTMIKKTYDAGYQLAIVTAGSRLSVERTLSTYGVRHMFSTTVAVEDVANSKPAPDCYELAMARLNRTAEECVAVEDTEHGMRAALRAGIPAVVIPTAHSQAHDFSDATAQYNSLQHWWAKAF
ncbi:HAD family phosphatase [Alteromonas sp. C1M14]|uniref:HAD family hydrolase n=1 Tax=Alteromonas sp. C1M14 TaxID=2841567 RepID=UPI001C082CF1|nr:HAD family phosphatase [Alteromonas sp. C1M14]MBU2977563.1 HAD family phosphatase [Alteromonas sp. C1M14]